MECINIKKVEELTKRGLMQPSGLEAFNKREEGKSRIYTYENEPVKLDRIFEKKFAANKKALKFFQSQAPSYKKVAIHWVMRAKQEATKFNRLVKLITSSEAEQRVF